MQNIPGELIFVGADGLSPGERESPLAHPTPTKCRVRHCLLRAQIPVAGVAAPFTLSGSRSTVCGAYSPTEIRYDPSRPQGASKALKANALAQQAARGRTPVPSQRPATDGAWLRHESPCASVTWTKYIARCELGRCSSPNQIHQQIPSDGSKGADQPVESGPEPDLILDRVNCSRCHGANR